MMPSLQKCYVVLTFLWYFFLEKFSFLTGFLCCNAGVIINRQFSKVNVNPGKLFAFGQIGVFTWDITDDNKFCDRKVWTYENLKAMERSAYIYVNLFSENLGTEYNHVHINSIYVIFANGIFFFFNQSFLIFVFLSQIWKIHLSSSPYHNVTSICSYMHTIRTSFEPRNIWLFMEYTWRLYRRRVSFFIYILISIFKWKLGPSWPWSYGRSL